MHVPTRRVGLTRHRPTSTARTGATATAATAEGFPHARVSGDRDVSAQAPAQTHPAFAESFPMRTKYRSAIQTKGATPMTMTARLLAKLALALAFVLAGAAAIALHAHQHADSLDAVWPDTPTAKREAAPPVEAQLAALDWPAGPGLTIELPMGQHFGERDRVATLFTTLLAQEYQAAWISRASRDLRAVMPKTLWPCLAALDADATEDFDVFNRWLLDPEYRLRRPGCTPSATTPTWYVPVRFALVASADAPRVAGTHMAVWVVLFVAGIVSIVGGLMRCAFILLNRDRVHRSSHDGAQREE